MRVFVFDAVTGDGIPGAEVHFSLLSSDIQPIPLPRETGMESVFLCAPPPNSTLVFELHHGDMPSMKWVFKPEEWSLDTELVLQVSRS